MHDPNEPAETGEGAEAEGANGQRLTANGQRMDDPREPGDTQNDSPSEETNGQQPTTNGQRVRLEDPEAKAREGRFGCLLTGAILGIIVGVTFAFYGLPPILRAIYGEDHVDQGETFTGDSQSVQVISMRRASDDPNVEQVVVHVFLAIAVEEAWTPAPENFQLELEGVEEWLDPLPAVPAVVETSLNFPPGEQRTLLLRYRLPERDAVPFRLHIGEPRLRLDLPPLE